MLSKSVYDYYPDLPQKRSPRSLAEAMAYLEECEGHYWWLTGRGSLDFPAFDAAELALYDARRWMKYFSGGVDPTPHPQTQ
jgi:hypothetical protein